MFRIGIFIDRKRIRSTANNQQPRFVQYFSIRIVFWILNDRYGRLKFVGLGPILVRRGRNATVTRRECLAAGGFFGVKLLVVDLFNVFINKLEEFLL